MKKLLTIALLLLCSCSWAQIGGSVVPGSLSVGGQTKAGVVAAVATGNPVTSGRVFELLSENYTDPGAGQPAVWMDSSGNGNNASQTVDGFKLVKVLATQGYVLKAIPVAHSSMSIPTFSGGKTVGNNTNTMVCMVKVGTVEGTHLSYVFVNSASENLAFFHYNSSHTFRMNGLGVGQEAYLTKHIAFVSFGTSAEYDIGSGTVTTGNSGSTPAISTMWLMGYPQNSADYGVSGSCWAFILYDRKLTTQEKANIRAWLISKYGSLEYP